MRNRGVVGAACPKNGEAAAGAGMSPNLIGVVELAGVRRVELTFG